MANCSANKPKVPGLTRTSVCPGAHGRAGDAPMALRTAAGDTVRRDGGVFASHVLTMALRAPEAVPAHRGASKPGADNAQSAAREMPNSAESDAHRARRGTSAPPSQAGGARSAFAHETPRMEMVAGTPSGTSHRHRMTDVDTSVLVRYRHPLNLILDSWHPAAPHIVITSAETTWDVLFVAAHNRPHYQHRPHLVVPDSPRGYATRSPHPQADATQFVPAAKRSYHEVEGGAPSPRPRRRRRLPPAFNQTHFKEMTDYAVWDRETYPDIVISLYRRLSRLSAFAAASVAAAWRDTYDDPAWSCPAERPFHWEDPAAAVLPHMRTYRGTTVVESPSPLLAPHLVINEPPPADPWVWWANVPPQPQDARFGASLTVPWAVAVNPPSYADQDPGEDADFDVGADADGVLDAHPDAAAALLAYAAASAAAGDVYDDDGNADVEMNGVPEPAHAPAHAPEAEAEAKAEHEHESDLEHDSEHEPDSRPESPAPLTPLDASPALVFALIKAPLEAALAASAAVPVLAI